MKRSIVLGFLVVLCNNANAMDCCALLTGGPIASPGRPEEELQELVPVATQEATSQNVMSATCNYCFGCNKQRPVYAAAQQYCKDPRCYVKALAPVSFALAFVGAIATCGLTTDCAQDPEESSCTPMGTCGESLNQMWTGQPQGVLTHQVGVYAEPTTLCPLCSSLGEVYNDNCICSCVDLAAMCVLCPVEFACAPARLIMGNPAAYSHQRVSGMDQVCCPLTCSVEEEQREPMFLCSGFLECLGWPVRELLQTGPLRVEGLE